MDYDEMLEKGREELPDDLDEGKRFEIPEADTQKDGSKTILRNFDAITSKFNRPGEHLMKYLLGELGTAGHIEGSELVLNGNFRRGLLNRKIEDYVKTFVRCSECGRPDTELTKEKGVEMLQCEACGARHAVED